MATITLKFGENISIFNGDVLSVYLFNNNRINEFCYSRMSFTGCLERIEARKLTGFCSIRVFRERYFRWVHSSKILLLLNYFIFVNLFELAIFSDHCLRYLSLFRRVTFFFSEIPVNLNQYRAATGVFNNRILITSKKHFYFSETSNMKNNLLFTTTINAVVLVFISLFKAFLTRKIGNLGLHWLFYLSYFSLFSYTNLAYLSALSK